MHNSLIETELDSFNEIEDIFRCVTDKISSRGNLPCNKSRLFIARYLANAVLSYIEEREQDLVLSMRYDEWVRIDSSEKEKISERVIEYIDKLLKACGMNPLDLQTRLELRKTVLENRIIEKTLCYLYTRGIYEDGISVFVLIKGIEHGRCEEVVTKTEVIEVRSRFIELAKYLFTLKQRFPDKSTFESIPLVNRVFAYAEPRNLPVSGNSPTRVYNEVLKTVTEKLYKVYNIKVLERQPDEKELSLLHEVLLEFFNYLERSGILLYSYQVEGVKKVLESTIKALNEDSVELKIIEAPTGAGKTEVFVVSVLVMAATRRLSQYFCLHNPICSTIHELVSSPTPIAIIVYPRLALASNQVERIIRYTHALNMVLKSKVRGVQPVTISMNYTDVRFRSEYEEAVRKAITKMMQEGSVREEVRLKYGVKVIVERDVRTRQYNLVLTSLKCHNGVYPRLLYDHIRGVLNTDKIICENETVDYIRVTKDDAKERPGDIHITLFETLRYNLLSKSWRKIFGNGVEGPLIIVLDEVHTYVGVNGARYAYVLRRVMARAKLERRGRSGFVIVGVSATIPNPNEFLRDLFFTTKLDEVFIKPSDKETVPMGCEYFFIIIPTTKYYIVNLLSVTIQSVMALYFNMPGFTNGTLKPIMKKTLVFIDNLDVVARAIDDIEDAINRHLKDGRNECGNIPYGLQDLRNPLNSICFKLTLQDYGDPGFDLRRDLHKLDGYNSWRDGELWWAYALEYDLLNNIYKQHDTVARIGEYTSRTRERVEELDIIIATSSLEVGIDYRDVVVIYQHGAPVNISALVQRAGRAGRRIFENPLTRTAVAIQLSPEIPTQTHYFEIFTRSRSLREALKYDRLYVPTMNKHIVEQTLIETVLDYLVATNSIRTSFSGENNVVKFECRELPQLINGYKDELLEYLREVFPFNTTEELSRMLQNIASTLTSTCRSLPSRWSL